MHCTRCGTKDKSKGITDSPNCRMCKDCATQGTWRKTPHGVINIIYLDQHATSQRRGHAKPAYTLEELKTWAFEKTKFYEMYENWVASGYVTDLKPSIDRLDDSKGYTFDNIRMVTWFENRHKQDSSNKRRVINSAGEIYDSIKEAAYAVGVNPPNISKALKKGSKSAGYYWEYAQ